MTTLAITPNWKNKSAKFKGTVAAGEHVSVTIQNENGEGGEFIEDVSTLRLRVVDPCNGRTLAIFPEPVPEGETPETWDSDLSPLRCTLNLNTVQMLKAVPPAANVSLLFVLDDYDNNTLYFKEQFPVEHWPRLRGEEEPTNLDDYKDIIEDFNARLTTAEQTVATAATNAQNAAASASAAAASASTAATAATDAQAGAIASKNAAQLAATAAATSATNASTAAANAAQSASTAESARQAAATSASEAAESAAAFVVDDTLSIPGAAADAEAVGEAKQDLITQINTVQGNLDSEVTARGTLAAAVGDNRQNLAAEIARAQSAEQSLDSRKADKTAVAAGIQAETSRAQTAERDLRADVTSAQSAIADRYTKTEVDTKIAGVQTFKKYLVQTLPDPDEADMKGLYLVSTGETSEEGDLCEEWTVVEEDGEKRWEKIGGGTAVDLSGYYTKTEVDAKVEGKVDKIPGKGLSTENYSTDEKTKLAGIAVGAQVNVIEGVKVNGTALTPTNKVVEIEIPNPTLDNTVTRTSSNGVKSSGIWSALWGALSALPTGFSSLYDWCEHQLGLKVDKENGKGLSTNDYTAADKTKLGGIEAGAKANVVEAASASEFPAAGSEQKIYVAKDENKTYRWDGTQYVLIGGVFDSAYIVRIDPANGDVVYDTP